MTIGRLLAAAALAVTFACAPPVRAADDHRHHETGDEPAVEKLALNEGRKWQIDPPLRAGMVKIRDEMSAALGPIHADEYSAKDYAALAARIEAHAGEIMSNCRLPPDADAQLHFVLADLFAGTRLMKEDGDRHAGAVRIVQALAAYPKFFDHEGWKPLGS